MSDLIVERADLEKKDRSELQTIISALGGSSASRAKKAELIDKVLQLSGATERAASARGDSASTDAGTADSASGDAATADSGRAGAGRARSASDKDSSTKSGPNRQTVSEATPQGAASDSSGADSAAADSSESEGSGSKNSRTENSGTENREPSRGGRQAGQRDGAKGERGDNQSRGRQDRNRTRQGGNSGAANAAGSSGSGGQNSGGQNSGGQTDDANKADPQSDDGNKAEQRPRPEDEDGNRRRRRRGRGRDRDDEVVNTEPVAVAGFLDLRDEGYGFLRVDGALPTPDDVYVPLRTVRIHGLRKGDELTGTARPANRNEKNPALHALETINGKEADEAKNRPNFEKLTPVFPDEQLKLERAEAPLELTGRIIDLLAPIGKGQRSLIVAPPRSGKTTVLKDIAASVEANHPDVHVIVLLLDERPEEVTDMTRHLEAGEVIASTFDRPPEEHCAVAEMAVERGKRMVEEGKDVVLIVDGITRLARAYNMAAPAGGRLMNGELDVSAIYPSKRFFGAARNLEEGGSLTIIATALVDTGSRMDEVIFEAFRGTTNSELKLDRSLADGRIYPAVDVLSSSTRAEEKLLATADVPAVRKLRESFGGLVGGDPAGAINMVIERLQATKSNAEFLGAVSKS